MIDQCKSKFGTFLRNNLPSFSQAAAELPTLPRFRVKPNAEKKRLRFVEETQPNWWQLPRSLQNDLFTSRDGRDSLALLERAIPFSYCIGKQIWIVDRGYGESYSSIVDIAKPILVSYLFEAGSERWNHRAFDRIWNDCLLYFDPVTTSMEYRLYAPIARMRGVSKQLDLGGGLMIRRLPAHVVARLASLNRAVAGVTTQNRSPRWSTCFLVKQYSFCKRILDIDSEERIAGLRLGQVLSETVSLLNEEVAILRSLLIRDPSILSFAFIRDGHPRDPGGDILVDLPWQTISLQRHNYPDRAAVNKYRARRAKFLELQGTPGWDEVAASMRRFAVAWENPFRADILADIVSALEHLVVNSDGEVGYKLRTRVSHLLSSSGNERERIVEDLKQAYRFRSRVFHGGFVLDNALERITATRLGRARGRQGNVLHDVNEVNRLIGRVTDYYRRSLAIIIDRDRLDVNWTALGL